MKTYVTIGWVSGGRALSRQTYKYRGRRLPFWPISLMLTAILLPVVWVMHTIPEPVALMITLVGVAVGKAGADRLQRPSVQPEYKPQE